MWMRMVRPYTHMNLIRKSEDEQGPRSWGPAVSYMLPFDFPGTLIAMFLLLILMGTGLIKEEALSESASFFSRYMALFFVPAGVEVIENFELLRSAWLEIAAISLISLFVTFFFAAKAVEVTEYLIQRRKEG